MEKIIITTAERFLEERYSQFPTQYEDLIDALDSYAMLVHYELSQNQQITCNNCNSTEMYQYSKTKDTCAECGWIQDVYITPKLKESV